MKFQNVSFGKKLGGAFGAGLLLLAAISLISYCSIRQMAGQASEAEKANQIALLFGAKIADHMDWLNTLDRFLIDPEGKRLQLQTDDHRCKLGQWFYSDERENAQESFPELVPLLAGLEGPHRRMHQSAVKLNTLFENADDIHAAIEEAKLVYNGETLPALRAVRAQMESVQTRIVRVAHENEKKLMELGDKTTRNIFILSLAAITLAVFLAVVMTRYVSMRINTLMNFVETIAGGDFTGSLNINGDDELGRLGKALNDMRLRLGTLMNEFVGSVVHLSSSSRELFGVSQKMADGVVNMSDKSNIVSAATDEMSANINSVAAASEQASTNISMVAAAAEELSATVGEIARSSENARTISEEAVSTANSASAMVNELGKAASQISKVTEVITEISEQTNLLALNATIEAARAGKAGQGFAVVANEIKELAKQTAVATQDIKTEIEGIQSTTTMTVDQITQITDVINRVDDIVSTIASAVEEQSSTTQEIATSVAQASEGIQEINVNVSQSSTVSSEIARDISVVSQVAGDMSNSSATVCANAGDVSTFTIQLKDMVGEFRLPAGRGSAAEAGGGSPNTADIPDLIPWNDSFTVNVKVFDDQHKQLVGLINKLHRAMKTRRAGQAIVEILSQLVDYTKVHFKAEEDAMRKHGYPDLADQEEKHKQLVARVAETQAKVSTGDAMVSVDVMDFLKDWLVTHIQGSDKEYGPFFNGKGVH